MIPHKIEYSLKVTINLKGSLPNTSAILTFYAYQKPTRSIKVETVIDILHTEDNDKETEENKENEENKNETELEEI